MSDTFHAEISIDEFKYAIGVWSAAMTRKLYVPEISNIPEDSGPMMCLEFATSDDKTIILYKEKDSPALPGYIAVAKEFTSDKKKLASVMLHCLIYEKILSSPLFKPYVDDRSLFADSYFKLIADIPIKIGEESSLNDLNMEYVLEKFKSI